MKKLLEKWPLMWKSTHESRMQGLTNEFNTILHNANIVDIQHEKVFDQLVKRSGAKLKLITLPNGFRAWEIDE